jgi:hypothetical protein
MKVSSDRTWFGQRWYGHRRSLFRLAAASLVGVVVRRLSASPGLSVVEQIARQCSSDSVTSINRSYSVNATVTFAGVPLFSKKNVGGACISVETSAGADSTITAVQFAAGSWPERLKGFNRFGMTQEIVREQSGEIAESAYISFMSSSPEKSLAEARQAFAAQEVLPLTIACGHSSWEGCSAQLEHDKVPGTYTWRNCEQIADHWRSQIPASLAPVSALPSVLPTFLFALRRAIFNNNGLPVRYAHNGKLYRLKTRIEEHPSSGHLAVAGSISSETEHNQTDFNLWLPASEPSALPIRIQWRARSFLVLTLEADDGSQSPPLHPLLNQERA